MLTPDEQRLLEKNEKMLSIPKLKFVLFYGSFVFGVLASIFVVGVTKLIGGNTSTRNIVFTFVGFMVAGAAYGLWMRKAIQTNRDRLITKKNKSVG